MAETTIVELNVAWGRGRNTALELNVAWGRCPNRILELNVARGGGQSTILEHDTVQQSSVHLVVPTLLRRPIPGQVRVLRVPLRGRARSVNLVRGPALPGAPGRRRVPHMPRTGTHSIRTGRAHQAAEGMLRRHVRACAATRSVML